MTAHPSLILDMLKSVQRDVACIIPQTSPYTLPLSSIFNACGVKVVMPSVRSAYDYLQQIEESSIMTAIVEAEDDMLEVTCAHIGYAYARNKLIAVYDPDYSFDARLGRFVNAVTHTTDEFTSCIRFLNEIMTSLPPVHRVAEILATIKAKYRN